MRHRTVLAAAGLLALVGCSAGGPEPGPSVPVPTGADELVFRLVVTGGPVPPDAAFALPQVSVYGDGLLVRAAPDTTVAAPALPVPTQRRITAAGIARLLDGARDAGLTEPTDFGTLQVPDGPVGTFTVPGRVTAVMVVDDDAGLDGAQRRAHERLLAFAADLDDLGDWLGDELSPGAPYPYTRLAAFAVPQELPPSAQTRNWPLEDLGQAGEPHREGRCVLLTGAELEALRDVAADARSTTSWRSVAATYHLTFCPLLPDEPDCRGLDR